MSKRNLLYTSVVFIIITFIFHNVGASICFALGFYLSRRARENKNKVADGKLGNTELNNTQVI
jgi:hypothetical protein